MKTNAIIALAITTYGETHHITAETKRIAKEQGADAAFKYFCEAHLDYITEVEEDYGPDIFDETAMFREWNWSLSEPIERSTTQW